MKVRVAFEWEVDSGLIKALNDAAQASGVPVTRLCEAAGTSTTTWYRLMGGEIKAIAYPTLAGVLNALDIPAERAGGPGVDELVEFLKGRDRAALNELVEKLKEVMNEPK